MRLTDTEVQELKVIKGIHVVERVWQIGEHGTLTLEAEPNHPEWPRWRFIAFDCYGEGNSPFVAMKAWWSHAWGQAKSGRLPKNRFDELVQWVPSIGEKGVIPCTLSQILQLNTDSP
jgi:hypothetical protein